MPQKKVEENNFGIRKRLLEYDDVMNSQREVIYTKRRNALVGDRVDIDVMNMMQDTSEILVENCEGYDFDSFNEAVMRLMSIDAGFDEAFYGRQPRRSWQTSFSTTCSMSIREGWTPWCRRRILSSRKSTRSRVPYTRT